MVQQNPKITVQTDTKELLDAKKNPKETYDQAIRSILSRSTTPAAQKPAPSVVAGANLGKEAYNTYTKTLGWITDTEKKLPAITPELREQAFYTDPLVSGIITPFLQNVLLGAHSIQTADNKKYVNAIKDIEKFLQEINLIGVFREDFQDYAIIHGKSFRRKDYSPGNILQQLQRLEPRATRMYEDPWDSTIRAYHQRIYLMEAFSSQTSSMIEYNSWFIPEGEKYIPDKTIGLGYPKTVWEEFKQKYKITDTTNLRVDSADKILAMHRVREGKPAPIDAAILAIWLKRMLLSNAPNVLLNVLYPFLHIIDGRIDIVTVNGETRYLSTVPEMPPTGMGTTDPEKYAVLLNAYNDNIVARKKNIDNALRYRAEGGYIASGPDLQVKPVESANTVAPAFIQILISQLNEDIGQALGFPVSLIMARGAELATTRTIQDIFNTVIVGMRTEYQSVADALIEERFKDVTWSYSTTKKDVTTETGTFTFKEAQVKFTLETGDVKDALKEAQTRLADMQMLQVARAIGSGKADIQALADERGFGQLMLDKFDTVAAPAQGMFGTQSTIDWAKIDGLTDALKDYNSRTQSTAEVPPHEKLTADEYAEIKRVFGEIHCSIGKDKDGYFAYTHRARSKSYPTIAEIPKSKLEFIETTSSIPQDLKPENIPKNEDETLKDELLATYQEAKKAISGLLGDE